MLIFTGFARGYTKLDLSLAEEFNMKKTRVIYILVFVLNHFLTLQAAAEINFEEDVDSTIGYELSEKSEAYVTEVTFAEDLSVDISNDELDSMLNEVLTIN